MQNKDLFDDITKCKVLKFWPTKKNANVFQSIIEVGVSCFNKLIDRGHVLIGLNSCSVYDSIQVPRFYKCNGLNHHSQVCKNNVSCPICAESHEVKFCEATSRKCSNCVNYKDKDGKAVNFDHTVWETERCSAFKAAVAKFKADLFPDILKQ